ncbi:hypothetical protein BHM03_00004569 [Ensete ventricosum]|nr:hypothetical protein BHM03_00004569 [Ensete ventricosum]
MIGCRSRYYFAPDRKSDFAFELVQESGRLRGLSQPGVVAAPPRVSSPGLGPRVTPFAKIPAWTWFVRSRKASVVTMNGAGLDAGEGNLGSVIILQKQFELVQESGRLRGLPQPGIVAALPRVSSPGLGPRVTPFAKIPSGEPVVELPTV